jgi:nucleoside-diphosphate-sugar epimerase
MPSPSPANVTVTGAGGFIGGYLVRELVKRGADVRAVDIRPKDDWYQITPAADSRQLDCRRPADALEAVHGAGWVFNLAADMGGMGFIETHKAECMLSVEIATAVLRASLEAGVERYFFSSSACVYAADKQTDPEVTALRETDAYPAMPEDGYGWEKLFTERLCRHFTEDFGLETRVLRYHNVYGPHTAWTGGREKAPAAMCRKVAEAKLAGADHIEIWGDGQQTRSFMFIDDCVAGTLAFMASDCTEPLNLGSSELVTILELADMVQEIADTDLGYSFDTSAPQGVRGRNSDNTRIREVLGFEPDTSLRAGLAATYRWVSSQVRDTAEGGASAADIWTPTDRAASPAPATV